MTPHPLYASALDHLRALVAFDTTSRLSNLALIEYLERTLQVHGAQLRRLPDATGSKASLVASFKDRSGSASAPGGIVLSGHTDVVPVDGQPWSSDPFTVTEREGKLYGRGTADMKSFLAACVALAPQLAARPLPAPVHMVFSYDEEIGCLAAPALAEFIAQEKLAPRLAVIGEPTLMRVVSAHKGIFTFLTTVTGHEAHSSLPGHGVNAIAVAAELIGFLQQLGDAYAKAPGDAQFDPAHTTVHVGTIAGGTARNIIPRECRFGWEIRPLPGSGDEDAALSRFRAACEAKQKEIQARFADTSIRTETLTRAPGLQHRFEGEAEAHLHALTGSNRFGTASFATEAGFFQRAGIPCIVCGPGSIEQAHKPDEFIDFSQISDCLSFLEKLFARLAP